MFLVAHVRWQSLAVEAAGLPRQAGSFPCVACGCPLTHCLFTPVCPGLCLAPFSPPLHISLVLGFLIQLWSSFLTPETRMQVFLGLLGTLSPSPGRDLFLAFPQLCWHFHHAKPTSIPVRPVLQGRTLHALSGDRPPEDNLCACFEWDVSSPGRWMAPP